MSGRDFKSFLAAHKSEIGKDTGLVCHFMAGHKPKYKENNYDQLFALMKVKQSSGNRALQKIESLNQINKNNKDRLLLQEHKRLWQKEAYKLLKTEQKIELELSSLRPTTPDFQQSTSSLEELYEDIIDYEDKLRYEVQQFELQTLQPVADLKSDIQEWLSENHHQLVLGIHDKKNENEISDVIRSVKEQQMHVLEQLAEEQEIMEDEFYELLEKIGFNEQNMKLPVIKIGVPEDIMQLECPDESLKHFCLKSFGELDEKYSSYIENLEEKYDHVIRKAPYGGWSELDHMHFKHIMSQYEDVSKDRRKLYLHRLKHEMNHKTREQLVSYEDWWFRYKSFRTQLKDLFHAWKRDKEDLTLRTSWLCNEACHEHEKKNHDTITHMQQKFVCNFLHEKLLEYKTEKLELMKLEALHRAQQEDEEERIRKQKEARESAKRRLDKEKVKIYKESEQRLSAKQREYDQRRMFELQEKQSEQRAYDLQRVKHRNAEYEKKQDEKKQKQLEEELEKARKEQKAKAMRAEIEKNVEHDPERIYEPTEAFKSHVATKYDDELEAQTPLFNTYTYSVEQVAQDKRLKLENALRRANIHMTEYARNVISNVPPPTKPRKDTVSTVFSND